MKARWAVVPNKRSTAILDEEASLVGRGFTVLTGSKSLCMCQGAVKWFERSLLVSLVAMLG